MQYAAIAQTLQDGLKLDRPPVGVAFVETPPEGVPHSTQPAPSACTFWRRAEGGVTYAAADQHYACGVGAMTMGFSLPESEQANAQALVGTMVELSYFSMDEVPHLPAVQKPHAGIVYGPLAEMPVEPDVVLLVANPFQMMLLSEAGDAMMLRDQPGLAAMGRPACAALARSQRDGAMTISLGCIGARTYVEVPDDRGVVVVPGNALPALEQKLKTMLHANQTLAAFHAGRKSAATEALSA